MWHGGGPLPPDRARLLRGIPEARLELLQKLALRVQLDSSRVVASQVPAGFTYLGQLVAHDMTRLIDPYFAVDKSAEISVAREHPLCLETLYGDGPKGTPLIYELSGSDTLFGRNGRLRLGLVRPSKGRDTTHTPVAARDIPRLSCPMRWQDPAPASEGFPVPSEAVTGRLSKVNSGSRATEPLLADQRNDDNLLISQLLTVFIRLHNKLYDVFYSKEGADAQAAFIRARKATIAIYQTILLKEFFPNILDGRIWKNYLDRTTPDKLVDPKEPNRELQVPPIFKHGAFRAGHAMIQESYRLARLPFRVSLTDVLIRETIERSNKLPITERWIIDFADATDGFFFKTPSDDARNMARSFAPSLSKKLNAHLASDADGLGLSSPLGSVISLTYIDYLRAEQTIGVTLKQIRGDLPASVFPDGTWLHDIVHAKQQIKDWLLEAKDTDRAGVPFTAFTNDEADQLAGVPPVPFLVLFDAMKANEEEKDGRLGCLGSALVARTVAPILKRYDGRRQAGLLDAARTLRVDEEDLCSMQKVVRLLDKSS